MSQIQLTDSDEPDCKIDLDIVKTLWNLAIRNPSSPNVLLDAIKNMILDDTCLLNLENLVDHLIYVETTDDFVPHTRQSFYAVLGLCVWNKQIAVFEFLKSIDVLRFCVNTYARINKEDYSKKYPLMREAVCCVEILRLLLDTMNVDPNFYVSRLKWSPLSYALHLGAYSSVQLLLNRDDVDAFALDKDDRSHMHYGSWNYGYNVSAAYDCCDLLGLAQLLYTTNKSPTFQINGHDKHKYVPLHYASGDKNGPHWMHRILLLLCYGADPNIVNNKRSRPIDYCVDEECDVFTECTPKMGKWVKDIVNCLCAEIARLVGQREDLHKENNNLKEYVSDWKKECEKQAEEIDHLKEQLAKANRLVRNALPISQHIPTSVMEYDEKQDERYITRQEIKTNHKDVLNRVCKWKQSQAKDLPSVTSLEEYFEIELKWKNQLKSEMETCLRQTRLELNRVKKELKFDQRELDEIYRSQLFNRMNVKWMTCQKMKSEMHEMFDQYESVLNEMRENQKEFGMFMIMKENEMKLIDKLNEMRSFDQEMTVIQNKGNHVKLSIEEELKHSSHVIEGSWSSWSSDDVALWICLKCDFPKYAGLVDAMKTHLDGEGFDGQELKKIKDSGDTFAVMDVLFGFQGWSQPRHAVRTIRQKMKELWNREGPADEQEGHVEETAGGVLEGQFDGEL